MTDFEDKSDMIIRSLLQLAPKGMNIYIYIYELHSVCGAESYLKIIHIEWRINPNGKCLEGCRDVGALSKVMPAIM